RPHDGRRCNGGERAGQGLGVYGTPSRHQRQLTEVKTVGAVQICCTALCRLVVVRPEGANHQGWKNPHAGAAASGWSGLKCWLHRGCEAPWFDEIGRLVSTACSRPGGANGSWSTGSSVTCPSRAYWSRTPQPRTVLGP